MAEATGGGADGRAAPDRSLIDEGWGSSAGEQDDNAAVNRGDLSAEARSSLPLVAGLGMAGAVVFGGALVAATVSDARARRHARTRQLAPDQVPFPAWTPPP